ncbi:MAG: carbohydrate porin, partial [Planctomycetota bacterium]
DVLGGWLRIGIEDGDAAVVYDTLYSGGIDINGGLWGRIQDNVGIGYAYIGGSNLDVASSEVFETYVRFGLTESLALTLDAQHLRDAYRDREPIDGWVFGARCVFEF